MAPSQITNSRLHPTNGRRMPPMNRGRLHPMRRSRLHPMRRGRLHRATMSATVPRPCITSPSTHHYRNSATKRRLQPALHPHCPCASDYAVSTKKSGSRDAVGDSGSSTEANSCGRRKRLARARAKVIERLDAPAVFEWIRAYPGYVPRKPKWMKELGTGASARGWQCKAQPRPNL
jgi:hypothetical protein